MNPDLLSWLETRNKSSNSALMCGVAAVIGMLTATIVDNDYLKIGACVGGALAARSGKSSLEIKEQQERHLLAHTQVADVQNQKGQTTLHAQYFAALSGAEPQLQLPPATLMPAIEAASTPQPDVFDWARIRSMDNWDEFPHIGLVAKTGWGKTHWLSRELKNHTGSKYICAIKGDASDWQGHESFGLGYNYQAVIDVIQHVVDIHKQRAGKSLTFEPIHLVIDDFPSVARDCPQILNNVILLFTDSRSTRIRVWLLAQGDNVKTWGFGAQGDLLDCMTRIRCGKFAVNYARKLQRQGLIEQCDLDWMKKQELRNQVIVGDEIGCITT